MKDLFKAQVDWHLYRRCLINLSDIYVGIDEAFENGISPLELVIEVIKQYRIPGTTLSDLALRNVGDVVSNRVNAAESHMRSIKTSHFQELN